MSLATQQGTTPHGSALAALLPYLGPSKPTPSVVYRHYDTAGALLYIGSTTRLHMRQRQVEHARGARWWRFVACIEQKPIPDRREAYAAEREAIQAERPIFNRPGLREALVQEEREMAYVKDHQSEPDRWASQRRRGVARAQRAVEIDAMLAELGVAQKRRTTARSAPSAPNMESLDLGEYVVRSYLGVAS